MGSLPDLPLLTAIVLTVVLTVLLIKKNLNRNGPLPPGPSGLPILGNALDMSGLYPWLKYTEWSKQYGDVVHIKAVGQSVIILSSPKALSDLLEQRGAIYSDRPRLIMGGELAGYVDSVPLCPYGSRLREYRKLIFEALTPRKVQDFFPLEEEKTREFLGCLLRTPDQFLNHTRRLIAAIVFKITHGYDLQDGLDPLMELAERGDHDFSEAASAGAFLVDSFPALLYLPRWLGFSWMKKAELFRKNMEELRDAPWEAVKEQVKKGTAAPSFAANLIEKNSNPTDYQEDIYKWVSTGFYAGGADTTVSAIGSFFLCMSLYPDMQRKAQEEVLRVVGNSRLPTFSDRPLLPYVNALINEVHRMNPVGPTALPHRSTKDDHYNGYFIPAGSIVIPNSWAVLHDPDVYPSPFEFLPERYFDNEAKAKGLNPDPHKFAFGYGRRVCPGQHLADNSLFIAVAMILSVFNISRADGKAPKPDFSRSEGYISSTICHPEPFKCHIVPRSEEAAMLIRANDLKEGRS
ncbi:cytochrome P450 [Desarmillaria tabescens]|uniref:Cytochrome P450 n=1 Tax=Armillaria tabescens TaxID=1929756 RepID=A0AA39MZZ5_ARMTA|nr:cytochrome P450 [Desarmillaria tabescens]KAK0452912.1 cytochrome P450 [Desarmillaria tabescens]